MAAYYYFAASLPALVWGHRPQTGLADFLAECDRLLAPGDAGFVRAAVGAFDRARAAEDRWKAPEDLGRGAAAEWFEWESCLRAELGLLRAQALGRAFECESRPLYPEAREAAKAAFDADSPYRAEAVLAEARFSFARGAISACAWDREWIALYGIALAILDRFHSFTEEAGAPRFEAAYAAVLGTIGA